MRTPEGYWSTPWTTEELAYLYENYSKIPVKEIAEHLGRSYNAVVLRAKIEGLKSRHRAGVNSLVEGYFREIDTPMKAYLLGLYMADGNISPNNQLKLELNQKDICLVELARNEIAPDARIGLQKYESSIMARFMVSSKDLANDLAKHGVIPQKTLRIFWPPLLSEEFANSFICGFFDGDGSLILTQKYPIWRITGASKPFLEAIQERVSSQTSARLTGPYKDYRTEYSYYISASGESARVLDEWIHRDVPGLPRKSLSIHEKDQE